MDGLDKEVAGFFAAEGQRLGLSGVAGSRRVIIDGLPPDIHLGTVLEAVSAVEDPENGVPGGIISAQIFDDPTCELSAKSCSAVIEFVDPNTTRKYVEEVKEADIYFRSDETSNDRVQHQIKAQLANSQSNDLRPDMIYMLLAEQTRSLTVPVLSQETAAGLLDAIGSSVITRAQYDSHNGSLNIEFVSMFEADRAYGLLTSGLYPQFAICEICPPYFTHDSTNRTFAKVPRRINIAQTSHCVPSGSKADSNSRDWKPFYRLSTIHRICQRNGVMPYELMDWLESRRNFVPTDSRILGSGGVTITRKAYTWSLDPEAHAKLAIQTGLCEEHLSDAWDDYFRLKKLPNLRRYEAYGAIASNVNSDQSERSDDTDMTSDTEYSSQEVLTPRLSISEGSLAPVTKSEAAAGRAIFNVGFTPKLDVVPRSQSARTHTQQALPWAAPETINTGYRISDGMHEILIQDAVDLASAASWDIVDYHDWLCPFQSCPAGALPSEGSRTAGDDMDLITFDHEAA
ncbi:hypothetical protein CC79DRAFT_574125 [Sarocladium strictum]